MAPLAVPPYLLFVLDLLESEWPPPSNLHELFIKQEPYKREWKKTQKVTKTFDTRLNLILIQFHYPVFSLTRVNCRKETKNVQFSLPLGDSNISWGCWQVMK